MFRKVPPKIYWPATSRQVEAQLRKGEVPAAFVRRMRTINMLSAATLMKIEDDFLLPFDVMDVHHVLDRLISQDAIIDQLDNDELSYALTTGNMRPLWDIAPSSPLLLKGFTSGWMNLFINEPFDPLCVMLAMRCKAMLDLIDEEGHSYNLIRSLGWGFIDFGDIEDEEPGNPGDYYPPEIDNPIDFPDIPVTPEPLPGDPGYIEPMPGDPGYVPPVAGEDGYVPGIGEPGYTEPTDPVPGEDGGGPDGGAPGGTGLSVGDLGGATGGGTGPPPIPPDPCVNVDDPDDTVSFTFTTDEMAPEETQLFELTGNKPDFGPENYIWRLTAGGGTLEVVDADPPQKIYGPEEFEFEEGDDIAGFVVMYTAPDANPDCVMNPVIELWCGLHMMARARLAINAPVAGHAYWIVVDRMCTGARCRETVDFYSCQGGYAGSTTRPCNNVWTVCDDIDDCDVCFEIGHVYDVRSAWQKSEGCCPVELL